MIINTFGYVLYFVLFIFSSLGYGFLTLKFFNLNKYSLSLGLVGLLGLFCLTFISYTTHIFFAHGYFHNITIHLSGFLLLLLFLFKYNRSYLPQFIKVILLIILFILALFIAKNHEDFPYYHLPYIIQIVENKLQFGIGFFNIAYRTPSSLFYLQSTFFLPFTNIFLFHSAGLIILIFANLFLLDNFYFNKTKKNFIKILSSLCFVFINITFARLGAYGTDRGGLIIAFIIFILAFDCFNSKKKNQLEKIKVVLILIAYVITIKSYFILYLLISLLLLFEKNNIKKIFNDFKIIISLTIFFILFLFINFSNSGCFLYPLKHSCFDNFSWSVTKEIAEHFSNWYELWSKAGATPLYRVENPSEYIKFLNWVPNWINNYFLDKGLKTTLIIFLIIFYYFIFFRSKVVKKKYIKFHGLYFLLIFFLFVWFNKHPDLRYGGYVLYSLFFFVPFSVYCSKFTIQRKYSNKFFLLTAIIIIIIFNIINLTRIVKSFHSERELYSFKNFPFFNVRYPAYQIILLNDHSKAYLVAEDMCWATPSPCLATKLNRKTLYNYQFFYIK